MWILAQKNLRQWASIAILCVFAFQYSFAVDIRPGMEYYRWSGPTTGPVTQKGKSVLFISQDSKNGGISTLYRHFQLAIQSLNWKVEYVDGRNILELIKFTMMQATQSKFDAVVLGGISASSVMTEVEALVKFGKIVAGWHALAEPGSTENLFVNIGTRSSDVADIAAEYVVRDGDGEVGVVIFNDDRFEVANAKTRQMVKIITECKHCQVLAVENINLGNTVAELPEVVDRLIHQHGAAWTHSLAINDLYFDSINYPLKKHGRLDIRNISAGDGSFQALNRIQSGLSTQVATVAEPVALQGWQLADELNRAFAGAPVSGIICQPILITKEVIKDKNIYDLEDVLPYKQWYKAIWEGNLEDIPNRD